MAKPKKKKQSGWGWGRQTRDPRLKEPVTTAELEQMKKDFFKKGGKVKNIPTGTSGLDS